MTTPNRPPSPSTLPASLRGVVTPYAFTDALKDLDLSTIQSKVAELLNSIAHLVDSNAQLRPFADGPDADADCAEAIEENERVLERNWERIQLCKGEVERRGARWGWPGVEELQAMGVELVRAVNGLKVVEGGQVAGEGVNGASGDEGGDGVHL